MKILMRSVFSLLLLTIVLLPATAQAQGVQDFVITSFYSTYKLTNEDPQGLLETEENIKVNFNGQNQGIFRYIPMKYRDDSTNPKIIEVRRDGKIEPYVTYEENDNLIVRIGESGTFITGEHEYEINYIVENVIRFYDNHDELFWDINGDGWLQPFNVVTADVRSDSAIRDPGVICYTGSYGDTGKDCAVSTESNSFKVTTTRVLKSGENLTVVAAYEKGYFVPQSWFEKYFPQLIGGGIIVLQFLLLRPAYQKWKREGKDYEEIKTVVPYYERPDKVSVLEAGYVMNNSLSSKVLTAGIVDLAIRGYIKITETDDKKPKHELSLLKEPDSDLHPEETYLIEKLFDSTEVGSVVKIEDKKHKLSSVLTQLSKTVDESTLAKGFYEASPLKAGRKLGKYFLLGILALVLGFFAIPFTYGLSIVTGSFVFIFLIVLYFLMTKRSQHGNMLKNHMEGLELFIKVAEKDRIKAQDAVAAPLAKNRGKGPVYDVSFFEKLLPFAMIFGLEKTWAAAFESLYTQPPDWYRGRWNNFSAGALAGSLSSTASATSAAFSTPSSSSGSGFSSGGGGGFSGGGGGGGGGGGW